MDVTTRRLGVLQWVGLLLGGAVWWGQHLAGVFFADTACKPGGGAIGIDHTVWQGTMMAIAASFVLLAEAAALGVLARTRDTTYEESPPIGRIRFFAIAAAVANILFLVIILLDGTANLAGMACRQS
jgi:hypothetical protein